MKNIKTRRIVIFGGIGIIVLGVLLHFLFQNNQHKLPQIALIGSTPSENASSVSVFDPLTITFNQPVDASTISVTSIPSENWNIYQSTTNSIRIDHKLYLRVGTSYKLTIMQNNNIIGNLAFETAHDQNDPRQLQNLQTDLNKNYPLAASTPYQTQDYRVVYSAPLTLEIDISSSLSSADAISQVKAWVSSNGIDPATHKYNAIVVQASPHP